jgi:hypothetical protein
MLAISRRRLNPTNTAAQGASGGPAGESFSRTVERRLRPLSAAAAGRWPASGLPCVSSA